MRLLSLLIAACIVAAPVPLLAASQMSPADAFQRAGLYMQILYFYKDDCKYCQLETPELKEFTYRTGLKIIPVNIRTTPEAFQAYGVKTTPTIVLDASQYGKRVELTVGFIEAKNLAINLYNAVRLIYGEISLEEYQSSFK